MFVNLCVLRRVVLVRSVMVHLNYNRLFTFVQLKVVERKVLREVIDFPDIWLHSVEVTVVELPTFGEKNVIGHVSGLDFRRLMVLHVPRYIWMFEVVIRLQIRVVHLFLLVNVINPVVLLCDILVLHTLFLALLPNRPSTQLAKTMGHAAPVHVSPPIDLRW